MEEQKQIAFTDDRGTLWRKFVMPGGQTLVINNPVAFSPQAGGQLIIDSEGIHHFVPNGWIHTSWQPRPPAAEAEPEETEDKEE